MPLRIHEIELAPDETESTRLENIKVEMKGLGPTVQVMGKTQIVVTNKRILIGQKILFSSKYQVRYVFWFGPVRKEKLNLGAGSIETSIQPDMIDEIQFKGDRICECKPGGVFDYLRIFVEKERLRLPAEA